MLTMSTTAARPINSLAPFRIAAASISSSSRKDASTGAVQQHGGHGLVKRERKEVLLPSQEGTKGVVQYALYVVPSPAGALAARGKIERASERKSWEYLLRHPTPPLPFSAMIRFP